MAAASSLHSGTVWNASGDTAGCTAAARDPVSDAASLTSDESLSYAASLHRHRQQRKIYTVINFTRLSTVSVTGWPVTVDAER